MAKKQKTDQNPETPPVDQVNLIKDKDQEILLVYDSMTGDVKAIGEIDAKKGKYSTVEATPKHYQAMYQAGASSIVGSFLKSFFARSEVPNDRYSFFRAPITRLLEVKSALHNRHEKVDDPDGAKLLKRYFVNEKKLNKIKFDYKELPLAEMKSLGWTREILEHMDELQNLQEGLPTTKRLPVNYSVGDGITHYDHVVLQAFHDASGKVKIRSIPALAKAEFLDPKYANVILTPDQKVLYEKGTLNRPILIENKDTGKEEWCLVSFNPDTNRLVTVPQSEVEIPKFFNGAYIDKEKKILLEKGELVQLEKCTNYAKDATWNVVVQYDPKTRELQEIKNTRMYYAPYVPPNLKAQLKEDVYKEFLRGKPLDGKDYKDREGKPYDNFMIVLNPKNNESQWVYKNNTEIINSYKERYARLTKQDVKQEPLIAKPAAVEELPEMDFDQDIPQQESAGPRIGA